MGVCIKSFAVSVLACAASLLTAAAAQAATEQILYRFTGPDGANPRGVLIADASGALYGTTEFGGIGCADSNGCGTVFKLTPGTSGYTERVIHSFSGKDGAYPGAGLIADASGALYGTTEYGGALTRRLCRSGFGCGVIFKLTPSQSGYVETVLHVFRWRNSSFPQGASPTASLSMDANGNLYGTTSEGGKKGTCCGTAFVLQKTQTGYTLRTIYRFTPAHDGYNPGASGLTIGPAGVLYGTTEESASCRLACGTVYTLTPKGSGYVERVIFTFAKRGEGDVPEAGVLLDAAGDVFGTTVSGGTEYCHGFGGCGTAFELIPDKRAYRERILWRFGHAEGFNPLAQPVADASGALFLTAAYGGKAGCARRGCGSVVSLTPAHGHIAVTALHVFAGGDDGAFPYAGLALVSGTLYGTTSAGGSSCDCGTVFAISD